MLLELITLAAQPHTQGLLAILFGAVIVRAAFGFGDVLVSVPFLTLFMAPRLVVPLMGLVGATNALLILLKERSDVQWRPVRTMLMASVVGVPVGVAMLKWLDERVISVGLGVVVVAYCTWSLLGQKAVRLTSPKWALPFGFAAGCMGGAVTATGPPVVAYASTQGWNKAQMRATMQGFFLPNGIFILVSHAIGGLWSAQMWKLYLLCLPVCLIGLPVGFAIAGKLSVRRFEQATMAILLVAGVLLLGT
jgi:hypothetical protein